MLLDHPAPGQGQDDNSIFFSISQATRQSWEQIFNNSPSTMLYLPIPKVAVSQGSLSHFWLEGISNAGKHTGKAPRGAICKNNCAVTSPWTLLLKLLHIASCSTGTDLYTSFYPEDRKSPCIWDWKLPFPNQLIFERWEGNKVPYLGALTPFSSASLQVKQGEESANSSLACLQAQHTLG